MMRKKKQVKAKLKIALILGERITDAIARRRWRTSRLASYVNRLNNEGFKVLCDIIYRNGDQFGEYYHPVKPKCKLKF